MILVHQDYVLCISIYDSSTTKRMYTVWMTKMKETYSSIAQTRIIAPNGIETKGVQMNDYWGEKIGLFWDMTNQ